MDFTGSNLDGFDFSGTQFINCNFSGASLHGAIIDSSVKSSLALDVDATSRKRDTLSSTINRFAKEYEHSKSNIEQMAKRLLKRQGERSSDTDVNDIIQSAIEATLSGKRVWRTEVPLTQHLYGVFRSYIYHNYTFRNQYYDIDQIDNIAPDRIFDHFWSPSPRTPEEILITLDQEEKAHNVIMSLLKENALMETFYLAIRAEIKGKELLEHMSLDKKHIDILRKRFSRLIEKAKKIMDA